MPNHDWAFPLPNINLIDDLLPFDPSLLIIPLTKPKPIVNLPSEPEIRLVKIPDPESDDDSDDDDIMNELYHFGELYINNVELEWFDLNKVVNSNGQWNNWN